MFITTAIALASCFSNPLNIGTTSYSFGAQKYINQVQLRMSGDTTNNNDVFLQYDFSFSKDNVTYSMNSGVTFEMLNNQNHTELYVELPNFLIGNRDFANIYFDIGYTNSPNGESYIGHYNLYTMTSNNVDYVMPSNPTGVSIMYVQFGFYDETTTEGLFGFDDYRDSYDDGYSHGYTDGYNNGYGIGSSDTSTDNYQNGYNTGYNVGFSVGQGSGYGFMNLFGAIADTPVLMFRSLFSFDLFGTSMVVVMLSLFTVLVIFHVAKKIIK